MDFFDVTIWTCLNNLYHVILLLSIAEFYLCLLNALMEIKYYLLTFLLNYLITYLLTYCYNCYNILYKSEPHILLTIIRSSPNMDSSLNSHSFSLMSLFLIMINMFEYIRICFSITRNNITNYGINFSADSNHRVRPDPIGLSCCIRSHHSTSHLCFWRQRTAHDVLLAFGSCRGHRQSHRRLLQILQQRQQFHMEWSRCIEIIFITCRFIFH